MFIKVFVPNSRGKIEFTIEELEELLSEACEKAVREKCATCNRSWYGTGVTYLNSECPTDYGKTICSSDSINATSVISATNSRNQGALSAKINELIGDQQ